MHLPKAIYQCESSHREKRDSTRREQGRLRERERSVSDLRRGRDRVKKKVSFDRREQHNP